MADDTGRCVNCGYLGKRRTVANAEPKFYTATSYDREQGTLNIELGWPDYQDMTTQPACFRNAVFLQGELADALGMAEKWDDAAIKDYTCVLIEKPRECELWYPWTEYLSPKEHFEEFKMQQLEHDRRDFELMLFNMNKKLKADSNRVMIGLAICAIILAAAQVFF